MKKLLIKAGITALAIITTESASAGSKVPAQISAMNSWQGIYAGANLGFSSSHQQLRSQQIGFTNPAERCDFNSEFSSFFPGLQLGYLHQSASDFVMGLETNLTFNTRRNYRMNCRSPYNPMVADRFTTRNNIQGSLKARAGRALLSDKGLILPFVSLGASVANQELVYQNEGRDYYSKTTGRAGWILGLGLEWAFNSSGSIRAEYNYIDYGKAIHLRIPDIYGLLDTNGGASVNLKMNTLALAINYWF